MEKWLHIAICKLAAPKCCGSVVTHFGGGRAGIGTIVIQVSDAMEEVLLYWVLKLGGAQEITNDFACMGFPNLTGVIAGTHACCSAKLRIHEQKGAFLQDPPRAH